MKTKQEIQIELLQEIDEICSKNNLKYIFVGINALNAGPSELEPSLSAFKYELNNSPNIPFSNDMWLSRNQRPTLSNNTTIISPKNI